MDNQQEQPQPPQQPQPQQQQAQQQQPPQQQPQHPQYPQQNQQNVVQLQDAPPEPRYFQGRELGPNEFGPPEPPAVRKWVKVRKVTDESRKEFVANPVVELPINIIGPKSTHVKLVANDGTEVFIRRKVCGLSVVLQAMLQPPIIITDNHENVVHLKNISGVVLDIVVKYMERRWLRGKHNYEMPEFEIPEEHVFDVLTASDFLEI